MTVMRGHCRVFAILGDPVAHSLSPAMHNAAFTALGLDAVYVPLRCRGERLPGLMQGLAEAGGGGNVTVPHKEAAAAATDRMEGRLPGACNTFWGDDGQLVGDNTDVAGVLEALGRLEAPATSWLVLGTGGASRAVAAAAAARGARLAVRSRSRARAAAFLEAAARLGVAPAEEAECELVVNATPLGLHPDDPLPVTPFEVPAVRAVLDLVYAAGGTPLVRAFRERGLPASDGREVLVAQGAEAFRRWFPEVSPPVEVMRAAVRRALG